MNARTAYLLLSLTALFWGGNAVAGRLAAGEVSPMLLTAMRWTLALAILLAIGGRRLLDDWAAIRPNLGLLAAYGTFGFAGFNILLYSAVNYTTAINVAIEQAGMPMLIFLANFVLFRTAVTPVQILGFCMTLVGVALTTLHGDLTSLKELQVNRGDALMLIAIILYAGYTVALRYRPNLNWQSLMIVMAASALLTAIPFAIFEYVSGNTIVPSATGWSVALYTAIFPAILAQVFYIRGVTLIGPNRAGIFINMVPLAGAALSILILGESFQLYHAVALALVLGGIWLSERSSIRSEKKTGENGAGGS